MTRIRFIFVFSFLSIAMITANIAFGVRLTNDYPSGSEYRVYGRTVASSYDLNPSVMGGNLGSRQPRRLFLALEASREEWPSITVVGDLGDMVYKNYIAAFSPQTTVSNASDVGLQRLDIRDVTARRLSEKIQFFWANSCNDDVFWNTRVISRALVEGDEVHWGDIVVEESDISMFLVQEFSQC